MKKFKKFLIWAISLLSVSIGVTIAIDYTEQDQTAIIFFTSQIFLFLISYILIFLYFKKLYKYTEYAYIITVLFIATLAIVCLSRKALDAIPDLYGMLILYVVQIVLLLSQFAYIFSSIANKKGKYLVLLLNVLYISGIFLKRSHIGGSNFCILISAGSLGILFFVYGILNCYKREDWKFMFGFRQITGAWCFIFSISYFASLFKFMHWYPSGVLVVSSTLGFIFFTIISIFTIPASFLDWTKEQIGFIKRNIILPWIITLIMLCFSNLYPTAWGNFLYNAGQEYKPFGMDEYSIPVKDGLE
jgi:hypothetical protein